MRRLSCPSFCLLIPALVVALAGACVKKDPDRKLRGRRPLTQAEKLRVSRNLLKAPPPSLRFPVNAELEGKLVYLGLDTPTAAIVPGKAFSLTHYWQVKEALPGWRLFVHSNGPGLTDFRNFDHHPVYGLYPVGEWKAGQIIQDRHSIRIPETVRYDQVEIYVGIWRGRARLKVSKGPTDGKDRVLAARLPIDRAGKQKPRVTRHYLVRRAKGPIEVDGKSLEPDWQRAASTGPFHRSVTGRPGGPRTEVRLLWDDVNLYLFFSGEDKHLAATLTDPDGLKLWTEQVYALLLDPQRSGSEYLELQLNPKGALYDAFHPRPGQAQTAWQSGAKTKVLLTGTLNANDDEDRGWQAELAIPWATLQARAAKKVPAPPRVGDRWAANFFRTDRDAKNRLQAWAWSPPLAEGFHVPRRFGVLVFVGTDGKQATSPAGKGAGGGSRRAAGSGGSK